MQIVGNKKKKSQNRCGSRTFWIGGGGRIRTIEAKRSRFTVCPLWPLGNSPIFSFGLSEWSQQSNSVWSRQTDSNPRPADYKSAALPTELCRRLKQNTLIIAMCLPFVKYFLSSFERNFSFPPNGAKKGKFLFFFPKKCFWY